MIKIYEDNGLPFWNHSDISTRDYVVKTIEGAVSRALLAENRGWLFERVEAPVLIPSEFVSKEYDYKDYFMATSFQHAEFALRPETTASSYEYAKYLFEHHSANPPLCVYQLGKSFRNENDQVSKNMRFKEFYQLEFQCIYTEQTLNDYHTAILEPMRKTVERLTGGMQCRLVDSDRLPSYSEKTVDVEVDMGYKWLEVCSISLRTDVPFQWNHKTLRNVEIAFGADRLVEVINGVG
jgi:glycyl-tRNA synthetase